MKTVLKKIFWRLPISQELKTKISNKRFEKILEKEKQYDSKGEVTMNDDPELNCNYAKYIVESYKRKSDYYRGFVDHSGDQNSKDNPILVAYYLTQFHPNPENDEWWGKGTTEWNNVNQAVPQYIGHYQPRKPGELGYYDLRIKDVLARQIELAKNYGIGAFCYYYYWFDGKRLLEKPLNLFLQNKDLDMPFFYTWVNENWTKRFSGTNDDILMGITQTEENYCRFIDSVLEDMRDDRYLHIDGKPVLSVYRPSMVPSLEKVLRYWRECAKKTLRKDLYLIAVQERDTSYDWTKMGFDAENEFHPKQIQHNCKEKGNDIEFIRKDFSGNVYDYADLVNNEKYYIKENWDRKVYPAIMPMWDNTARRNFRGIVFDGSTPELYKKWLKNLISRMHARDDLEISMVFINAWNEWGEGAYLEPDEYFGYAYLQATWEALKESE